MVALLLNATALLLTLLKVQQKRRDYAFLRQLNEKPGITLGCLEYASMAEPTRDSRGG